MRKSHSETVFLRVVIFAVAAIYIGIAYFIVPSQTTEEDHLTKEGHKAGEVFPQHTVTRSSDVSRSVTSAKGVFGPERESKYKPQSKLSNYLQNAAENFRYSDFLPEKDVTEEAQSRANNTSHSTVVLANENTDNFERRLDYFGKYRIAAGDYCKRRGASTDMLVWVHSSANHFSHRRAIRDTWGGELSGRKRNVGLVFAVGEVADRNMQTMIYREHDRYGDIVQMRFIDTYSNMSYKAVGGIWWTEKFCPQAKIFMKTNDDTLILPERFHKWFLDDKLRFAERTVCGLFTKTYRHATPSREEENKWYVPTDEWEEEFFAHDAAPGLTYFITTDLLSDYIAAVKATKWLRLEDIWITGVLREYIHTRIRAINTCSIEENAMLELLRGDVFTQMGRVMRHTGTFLIGEMEPREIRTFYSVIRKYDNLEGGRNLLDHLRPLLVGEGREDLMKVILQPVD